MSGADDDVWPSVSRLVSFTGLAERTVRDVLRGGRMAGWLSITERAGDASLLRIIWTALAEVPSGRTTGERKAGKGRTPTPAPLAAQSDDTPAPVAWVPLRPLQPTPAPVAALPEIAKTDSLFAFNAVNVDPEPLRPLPPKQKRTIEATIEATILSATADQVPSSPEKHKSAKTTKRTAKTDPHPCHQRVIDAWDRVWRKTRMEPHHDPTYPWSPRDIAILVKQIRDPYVSRDPAKFDADMQRLGAAMTRYLSQEVDGRFVKGLSIKGFAGDVARWFTPADAAVQIRRGPTEYRSISDLLGESEIAPTANRDALDVAYQVIP